MVPVGVDFTGAGDEDRDDGHVEELGDGDPYGQVGYFFCFGVGFDDWVRVDDGLGKHGVHDDYENR